MSCVSLSTKLPNHTSFCDTNPQKIVLVALAILALSGCALGVMGHFNLIPMNTQWIGWGVLSVSAAYPIAASIGYLIHRRGLQQTNDNDPVAAPATTVQQTNPFSQELAKLIEKGLTGDLAVEGGGFVHVRVNSIVFNRLHTLLKAEIPGLKLPFQPGKSVGSHVTVITPRSENVDMTKLSMFGSMLNCSNTKIVFDRVIGHKRVEPKNHPIVRAFHVIQVKSTALEEIRNSLGLTQLQKVGDEEIEFHITIGEEHLD